MTLADIAGNIDTFETDKDLQKKRDQNAQKNEDHKPLARNTQKEKTKKNRSTAGG